MKKIMTGLAILSLVALLSGCATPMPIGMLYTELTLPMGVTGENIAKLKVGKSECKSVLGLVAIGDASVETAAKNGGITRIHHVDWEAKNILGVIGEYHCIVYGE